MDLLAHKQHQIDAQADIINELTKKIAQYETFIFELCSRDCSNEYKTLIKQEIWNDKN